jgi:hypothetical protein
MKTMKTIKLSVLGFLAFTVLSLSSCLKDPRFIDYGSSPPMVDFPLASYNSNKTVILGPAGVYAVVASAGDYTLPVTVNLASPNLLSEPVTFTVAVDNSTLTALAASTTKASAVTPATVTTPIPSYFPLPAADYALTGASGTIPAGQRTAIVNVTLHGALIGNTIKNYGLRLVITTASVQISSWNVQTYLLQLQ